MALESWGCRSDSQFKCLFGSGSSRVWRVTESCILSPGFATYWPCSVCPFLSVCVLVCHLPTEGSDLGALSLCWVNGKSVNMPPRRELLSRQLGYFLFGVVTFF